jgi:epoxyqueuosine reductase
MSELETQLKTQARALGFDVARIARADEAWPAGAHLAEFVAEGRHGDMGWMAETVERRQHPTNMWPGAKSALVVGLNYGRTTIRSPRWSKGPTRPSPSTRRTPTTTT